MNVQVLDEQTVNQIAAGEVVERPASVVKELVENSLDAGARHVEVVLTRDETTVTDDGCGMSREDLLLSVERHATSKIRRAGDLVQLATYGFRGEALPSIAAVSELEIRTRRPEDEAGWRLVVSGGARGDAGPAGMPPGTSATVRGLFFNTPVRARFLKSPRTELARSLAALERLALARPDVGFRCLVEGRLALHTPGTGDLREAVLALFGLETARNVREARAGDPDGRTIVALVGGPGTGLSTRRRQGVWVNGRPVSVRGLLEATEAAYPFGVLPGQRHPLLLLFLHLPPAEVDANVHPTKAEVRLQRQDQAFALAVSAVLSAPGPQTKAAAAPAPAAEVAAALSPPARRAGGAYPTPGRQGRSAPRAGGLADWPAAPGGLAGHLQLLREEPGWPGAVPRSLADLRPLGQCGGRWLACDGPGGLYLVDQHAAHERIIFESLAGPGLVAGQPLAVPLAVDLAPADFETWLEHRQSLEAAGLRAEHFGERGVLLREVPLTVSAPSRVHGEARGPADLLLDVLSELAAEAGPSSALPERLRTRRALASCLAAVKAREPLSEAEMRSLAADLAACAEPWRCPHGRPTVVFLSHEELAQRFGR